MLTLENLPAFDSQGLSLGECSLSIELVGAVSSLEQAWKLLPDQGQGYVVCAGENRRFASNNKQGLLLEAEVTDGSSTILLRSDGPGWKAWKWKETPGSSHRWVEQTFLSSEPDSRPAPIRYRQYWTRQEEAGLQVWRPVGARFCGFVEENK